MCRIHEIDAGFMNIEGQFEASETGGTDTNGLVWQPFLDESVKTAE